MMSKYSVYYCGTVYGLEPVGTGWIVSRDRGGVKSYLMLTRQPGVWWDRVPLTWWTADRQRARVYARRTATKHLFEITGWYGAGAD